MRGKLRDTRLGRNSAAGLGALLACSTSLLLITADAHAQESFPLPRNNYGSVGLIDMPSARMAPDGELDVGAFFTQNIQRYNLGFQALPWLEVDFRYSGLQRLHAGYPVYFDRSFAAKVRLFDEGDVMPAVALGINDLVGTGIYGGEYVVASKRVGNVDATLGMGWGRMGATSLLRNPLSLFSSSFGRDRPPPFTDQNAGATNFSTLFHGHDVGLFGGLAWNTPIDGLSLVGEYSSDAYTLEADNHTFRPHDQINLGVSYQLADTINTGVSWLYGRAVGGSVSFQLDPVHDPYPQRIGPEAPEPAIRTPEEQRAALNNLTRLHDIRSGAALRARAYLNNAQLADRLWQVAGLSDVSVRGHALVLTVTQGEPAKVCGSVARYIGGYDTAITNISVTRGHASARCPVTPGLILVDRPAARLPVPSVPLDLLQTPLLTIDAEGRTPASDAAAIARIRAAGKGQNIFILAVDLGRADASIYYANNQYFHEADAIDRLTKILMRDAPAEIEKFRLISVLDGHPVREFDILRAPTERSVNQTGDIDLGTNMTALPAPMRNPALAAVNGKIYPDFSWSIFPQFRQQLFDPVNPFGVQFLAGVGATVEFLPGLYITGEAEASLYDDFNTNRPPSSDLPHVRTDFLQYFTKGKNGIGNLNAEYDFRISPTVFAALRAGYLESMYAGGGGEVLWRPEGQRWALGADLYEVQKRNFDRLFGLQDYHVLTGHVSLYYASPWYDLNFIVRSGQYLAGDRGMTFELTRRFDTGVEIGAFFSTTNVSAQQFGEGSFDKGIIIRIPLSWVMPVQTQGQLNLDLRPVQRDGGQSLYGDARLYDATKRVYEGDLARPVSSW